MTLGDVRMQLDVCIRGGIPAFLKRAGSFVFQKAVDNLEGIVDGNRGKHSGFDDIYRMKLSFPCLRLIDRHIECLFAHFRAINGNKDFIEHSKSKNGLTIESKIITKNGEIRDVIIKGHLIKLGKRKAVQGIFRDITEYQKIQANLLKERDTLEKVTGNLNTSLLIISKDCHILWANNYIKNIVGDITGKLCYSALNRLDHICPGCKVNEVIETGKQAIFEMHVPNPEGKNLPEGQDLILEITAIPIKDKKGNVTEILELAQDVTEQQKAEDRIIETLKQMETINEKLTVIGKLTRHDTRNKLAIIVNSTYLAKNQIENKTTALEHLEKIDSTIDQIEKILEFSRIYELLGTQEKTSINIKKILDEAFMLAAKSNEIELLNDCEDLTVQADSLLRQVFYNLIENSAKHGEKVTQIKVNYQQEKNALKIIYSDNGSLLFQ